MQYTTVKCDFCGQTSPTSCFLYILSWEVTVFLTLVKVLGSPEMNLFSKCTWTLFKIDTRPILDQGLATKTQGPNVTCYFFG